MEIQRGCPHGHSQTCDWCVRVCGVCERVRCAPRQRSAPDPSASVRSAPSPSAPGFALRASAPRQNRLGNTCYPEKVIIATRRPHPLSAGGERSVRTDDASCLDAGAQVERLLGRFQPETSPKELPRLYTITRLHPPPSTFICHAIGPADVVGARGVCRFRWAAVLCPADAARCH